VRDCPVRCRRQLVWIAQQSDKACGATTALKTANGRIQTRIRWGKWECPVETPAPVGMNYPAVGYSVREAAPEWLRVAAGHLHLYL